ncbi:MAG: type 4a pilus biogenesis protein PilO [Pseudomonadota bacterium]
MKRALMTFAAAFCVLIAATLYGQSGPSKIQLRALAKAQDQTRALQMRIDELQTTGEAPKLDPGLLWTGQTPTNVLSTLQSRLSAEARAANLTITSLSARPEQPQGRYTEYPLRLEGSGSYDAVLQFLMAVKAARPALGVSSLSLRPVPGRPSEFDPPEFYATLTVFGLSDIGVSP